MAEIKLTAQQISNLGLWKQVCDYKGWEYLSFDRVDPNELITFDDNFEEPEDQNEKKIKMYVDDLMNDWDNGYFVDFGETI